MTLFEDFNGDGEAFTDSYVEIHRQQVIYLLSCLSQTLNCGNFLLPVYVLERYIDRFRASCCLTGKIKPKVLCDSFNKFFSPLRLCVSQGSFSKNCIQWGAKVTYSSVGEYMIELCLPKTLLPLFSAPELHGTLVQFLKFIIFKKAISFGLYGELHYIFSKLDDSDLTYLHTENLNSKYCLIELSYVRCLAIQAVEELLQKSSFTLIGLREQLNTLMADTKSLTYNAFFLLFKKYQGYYKDFDVVDNIIFGRFIAEMFQYIERVIFAHST
jgi:hypothetical protein